ncbi:hypothetical protein B484DRAFT_398017 [Ochromonadaceae sp. CCMP2298]|nr:hypothetical protein B484DRAFT_398017 [Ochromonadaceae sp. CCMP2298]
MGSQHSHRSEDAQQIERRGFIDRAIEKFKAGNAYFRAGRVEAAKGKYFDAAEALQAGCEVEEEKSPHAPPHAPRQQPTLQFAAKRMSEISGFLVQIKNQRLQLHSDDRTSATLQGALSNLKEDILFHRRREQKALAGAVERHSEAATAGNFYAASLQLRQGLSGPWSHKVAQVKQNLATVLSTQGQLPGAVQLMEEALSFFEQVRGSRG